MKKIALIFSLTFLLGVGAAFALESQDGTKLSGPHYQFNIIGHPKNVDCIGGDESNGRAIMVPLKTAPGPTELQCTPPEGDYQDPQNVFIDDTGATWTTQAPTGARIYFQCGPSFDIIDRDACDDRGTIQVECGERPNPLYPDYSDIATEKIIGYEVFIRVLGKKGTCMNITGYALDELHQLWFQTGTVYLNRSTGKSTFVKATDLFDTTWCDVVEVLGDVDSSGDPIGDDDGICETGEACECASNEVELSVFNDIFSEYFWNILNNGTRLVQVRLYPVTE